MPTRPHKHCAIYIYDCCTGSTKVKLHFIVGVMGTKDVEEDFPSTQAGPSTVQLQIYTSSNKNAWCPFSSIHFTPSLLLVFFLIYLHIYDNQHGLCLSLCSCLSVFVYLCVAVCLSPPPPPPPSLSIPIYSSMFECW